MVTDSDFKSFLNSQGIKAHHVPSVVFVKNKLLDRNGALRMTDFMATNLPEKHQISIAKMLIECDTNKDIESIKRKFEILTEFIREKFVSESNPHSEYFPKPPTKAQLKTMSYDDASWILELYQARVKSFSVTNDKDIVDYYEDLIKLFVLDWHIKQFAKTRKGLGWINISNKMERISHNKELILQFNMVHSELMKIWKSKQ